ncbi:MAG: hypothetical protein FD139_1195 [Methylocystaceae bacterium]|nr:MAG: hypothetical protein FD148_3246 [Methylocystaceae bacterium]KAF0211644.1 MAG: hypothetical protein FD172_1705 [Methylocystaceae bacterium]TXT46154.1 MAG: hypothetical protein FD139_1195 [Methylocystaceae bacterium]
MMVIAPEARGLDAGRGVFKRQIIFGRNSKLLRGL